MPRRQTSVTCTFDAKCSGDRTFRALAEKREVSYEIRYSPEGSSVGLNTLVFWRASSLSFFSSAWEHSSSHGLLVPWSRRDCIFDSSRRIRMTSAENSSKSKSRLNSTSGQTTAASRAEQNSLESWWLIDCSHSKHRRKHCNIH